MCNVDDLSSHRLWNYYPWRYRNAYIIIIIIIIIINGVLKISYYNTCHISMDLRVATFPNQIP